MHDPHSPAITFAPQVGKSEAALRYIHEYHASLSQPDKPYVWAGRAMPSGIAKRANAISHVLEDLRAQGWAIEWPKEGITLRPPMLTGSTPQQEKARLRAQEVLKRDEQLRQPAVRAFISQMETPRLYKGRWVSVFSLMREGSGLVQALMAARTPNELTKAVDPYLAFAVPEARCPHTGLRLQEIWRYFRHTWSSQYNSTPGRTLMFLVRDRAGENHPVIGIGALGSPIVQMASRDRWIGWDADVFLAALRDKPSRSDARWLRDTLNRAISEIYIGDFRARGTLTTARLNNPTPELVAALKELAVRHRTLHHKFVRASDHKQSKRVSRTQKAVWLTRAKSHLFTSKRAESLSALLSARRALNKHLGSRNTSTGLMKLLASHDGIKAIRVILRKAKADRVGIAMADITVCGAVAPYNHLLGGKLVSMLAVSPETVGYYYRRYRRAVSEIASGMAGRTVVRPARLVLLGTTSLYGSGSSQYNRLRMPADLLGGPKTSTLEFLELGRSRAYGTSHFRESTVDLLVSCLEQSKRGQRVNSIFGEGVSPKLRKVREGLEYLGFPADELLRHGRPRIIYGVPLVTNMREYLLGIERRPRYLFSKAGKAATASVAAWWRSRWLAPRIQRKEVIERVGNHIAAHGLHGSQVQLPETGSPVAALFPVESDVQQLEAIDLG